jgi:5-methylcytosine-specific restriction endonuclease McrA
VSKLLPREPVELAERGAMSASRKRRIHTMRKGKCWMCGLPVPPTGPEVRYDHKLPLELGGSDDDANLWPLHREPCDRIKTAADARRIAKMRRQADMLEPTQPSKRPLKGRKFSDSPLRKLMNGSVVKREERA